MKCNPIKWAVITVLGIASTQALATGLVSIPSAGFSGTAYTLCNTTGNFGSSIAIAPTTGANNTCAVFPSNEARSPVSGYTLVASTVRTIPSVTGGSTSIGNLVDRVWRNTAKTMCIFGTRLGYMTNTDHDAGLAGTQLFEVNDIARGGFASSGDVNAGYYIQATNASPIYRIGRTYTSVQHRAYKYDNATNKALVGTNYLSLPTANSVTAEITGENSAIGPSTAASTTAATQDAVVNSNWVDFTADTVYVDDDGNTNSVSAMTYVQAACDATSPSTWVKSGAIRLRQTAQEYTNFKEIAIDGYAPPGATVP